MSSKKLIQTEVKQSRAISPATFRRCTHQRVSVVKGQHSNTETCQDCGFTKTTPKA